ncbi:hypothetical protein [Roseateles sp. P5_D6]
MNTRYFLLAVSLALTACAAPNISRDFSLEKSSSTGVATGSITYDGGYAAYRLHVENKVSGQKFLIEHGSSQTLNLSLAFKGEDPNRALGKKGSPFAIELPAGIYIVKSWQVSQGMANVWSTAPTGIEFEVKPREAIYLGGFYFRETSRFGRAVTASTVTLSDQSARDLPAIRSEFSALATVPLTQSLSTGAKLENIGGASDGKISIPIFIPVVR